MLKGILLYSNCFALIWCHKNLFCYYHAQHLFCNPTSGDKIILTSGQLTIESDKDIILNGLNEIRSEIAMKTIEYGNDDFLSGDERKSTRMHRLVSLFLVLGQKLTHVRVILSCGMIILKFYL